MKISILKNINKGLRSLLCLAAVACPAASKASISLYEVHTLEALLPLIIPVRSSETIQNALNAHAKLISSTPELAELFNGRTPVLSIRQSKKLELNPSRENRVLLVANLPKDYTKDTQRVQNFAKIFKQQNQTSFILPIAAGSHLSLNDKVSYHQAIIHHFPMLVSMGGDDVNTDLYKQQDFHSRNTIKARDEAEIALIKAYTKAEKGFLLGVCRGSQISAVALGYKLIQDVPFQIGESVKHSDHWHDIKLFKTSHQILKSTQGTGNSNSMYVNSLHHQAVVYHKGGPLELAAIGSDGVTEATEFKNGKGMLLQFHPELMNNKLGTDILHQTIKHKNNFSSHLCSSIFN